MKKRIFTLLLICIVTLINGVSIHAQDDDDYSSVEDTLTLGFKGEKVKLDAMLPNVLTGLNDYFKAQGCTDIAIVTSSASTLDYTVQFSAMCDSDSISMVNLQGISLANIPLGCARYYFTFDVWDEDNYITRNDFGIGRANPDHSAVCANALNR